MNFTRKLLTREAFLTFVTATFSGLAGIAAGIPITGYMLAPLFNQNKDVWRNVAEAKGGHMVTVDTIPVGKTVKVVYATKVQLEWNGSTGTTAAWLRRVGQQQFLAYAIFCTHLGCPVQWLGEQAGIFLCPCHGSVFNADGTVAGGPAPRPLFQYETRVQNGMVQIKSTNLPVVGGI